MIHEHEIRRNLALMLSGDLPLAVFGEWLASESWNMFADGSDEAIALVAAINIRLDAFSDGLINWARLRRELLSLVNDAVMEIQFSLDLQPAEQPISVANPSRMFASPHRFEQVSVLRPV
jgi:hypothetical protein